MTSPLGKKVWRWLFSILTNSGLVFFAAFEVLVSSNSVEKSKHTALSTVTAPEPFHKEPCESGGVHEVLSSSGCISGSV